MRFRIVKGSIRYFPQAGTQSWDGICWVYNWQNIGCKEGYTTVKAAELACVAYKVQKEPEIVKEFEYISPEKIGNRSKVYENMLNTTNHSGNAN